jgi:DNA polymerase sigma
LQDIMMSGRDEQVGHLGSMLLSFLQRYGVEFDLDKMAVAVNRGGFAEKGSLVGFTGVLFVEDPISGAT